SVEDALNAIMYAESPLFAKAGFRVVKLGDGYAEISFPMSDYIKRRGGMVHGGIIMYVLDSVCGLAVISRNKGFDQFTVELKVNFLEQLQKSPFKAVGKIVRMGGRLAVAEGEVMDADDKVCAKALGTWYTVKSKTEDASS
ncbi:MAG: PaaI family thioesterase, partial [Thermoprotei archaeon]